ncbi:hypothetical protein POTOM_012959 [Populus tomentosa]|uniref:Uncharacterized protein n=1 Tax=Populus tomentosa TaxID=118781 RepID=A0A8X8AAK2_POPTO|nr:hypothetical protein POTOM_012959 [Populus tomentosa]
MVKEWWEGGSDESRLLIAPAPSLTAGDAAAGINGCLLLLRHPKSGMCVCVCVRHLLVIVPLHKHLSNFIFFQGTRQTISLVMIMRELCSKNFTGSSNHIRLGFLAIMFLKALHVLHLHNFSIHTLPLNLSKACASPHSVIDGSLYTATPVDPVFILLPIFEEARMKKRDDLGKFRQLDEIIFINDYPGYQHLMSIAENCMGVVCEIKGRLLPDRTTEPLLAVYSSFSCGIQSGFQIDLLIKIGSSKFFRLDDSKVLAWLYCKLFQLKKALCSLDKNYAAQDEKYTLAEAVSILGEYVKDEPWLMLLLDHLKLNLLEVTSKVPEAENFPTNSEHNPVSSSLLQEKGRSEEKTKRSGKQAKKAKVETESRNIREMFRRACRKS